MFSALVRISLDGNFFSATTLVGFGKAVALSGLISGLPIDGFTPAANGFLGASITLSALPVRKVRRFTTVTAFTTLAFI
jgi:hypothetical protein